MSTLNEPIAMTSGGPTQVAMSPTRAAGKPPISTVTAPGGRIGPPTCGTTPVTIGQTCISVILAAGGIWDLLLWMSLRHRLGVLFSGLRPGGSRGISAWAWKHVSSALSASSPCS